MPKFHIVAALSVAATLIGVGSTLACFIMPVTAKVAIPTTKMAAMIAMTIKAPIDLVRTVGDKTVDVVSDGGLIDVQMSGPEPAKVKIRNQGANNSIRINVH